MARRPSNYRVRDLEVAIKTVQKRGLTVVRVEIAQDGQINRSRLADVNAYSGGCKRLE